MSKRVLIQCGDSLENTRRVLALCSLLREAGHRPVAGVYTEDYAGPFKALGFDWIALHRLRPARAPKDLAAELGVAVDLFRLQPTERAAAALSGQRATLARHREATKFALVAGNRAVETLQADALVVWNGVTGHIANALRFLKAAHGLPGGFIERGILADGLFFDPVGTNGASLLANGSILGTAPEREARRTRQEAALLAHFPFLEKNTFLQRAKRRRSKMLFVPLQVQGDSNILLYSPHFKTMRRLVIEAIELRDRWFPDHEIVVRPHPEEVPGLRLNLPSAPGLRVTAEGGLYDFLQEAPVTITVNSTVGLEAAWNGSLPIVYGDGIYCAEPFVLRQRPGAACDPRPALQHLIDTPDEAHLSIVDYMSFLLDGHIIQPLKRIRSQPEALLRVFAAAPGDRTPHLASARESLRKVCGLLHCHVLMRDPAKRNLDYRHTNQDLRAVDIERTLQALLGTEQEIVVRRGAFSDKRHIALADHTATLHDLQDYAIVLTQEFAVHSATASRLQY